MPTVIGILSRILDSKMSRSRRHTPISGITKASTEKTDKRLANRKARKRVKEQLSIDPEVPVLPLKREVSNVWLMDKDGKMRFDATRHPKLMRK